MRVVPLDPVGICCPFSPPWNGLNRVCQTNFQWAFYPHSPGQEHNLPLFGSLKSEEYAKSCYAPHKCSLRSLPVKPYGFLPILTISSMQVLLRRTVRPGSIWEMLGLDYTVKMRCSLNLRMGMLDMVQQSWIEVCRGFNRSIPTFYPDGRIHIET